MSVDMLDAPKIVITEIPVIISDAHRAAIQAHSDFFVGEHFAGRILPPVKMPFELPKPTVV